MIVIIFLQVRNTVATKKVLILNEGGSYNTSRAPPPSKSAPASWAMYVSVWPEMQFHASLNGIIIPLSGIISYGVCKCVWVDSITSMLFTFRIEAAYCEQQQTVNSSQL